MSAFRILQLEHVSGFLCLWFRFRVNEVRGGRTTPAVSQAAKQQAVSEPSIDFELDIKVFFNSGKCVLHTKDPAREEEGLKMCVLQGWRLFFFSIIVLLDMIDEGGNKPLKA